MTEKKSDSRLRISESSLDNSTLDELKKLAQTATTSTASNIFSIKPQKIDEKVERARKRKIANDNVEKDQQLKEDTLRKLFRFLTAETIIIFALAFLQGFGWWRFKLDEWSFRLVITATIGQITAMLTIAVQHLFPKKK